MGDEDDDDCDYNGMPTYQMPRYYMTINLVNVILVAVLLITYRRTVSVDGSVIN
jgi:hypothetical protein